MEPPAMNPRAVKVESDRLTAIAMVNGRARSQVFVYRIDDLEHPLAVESVNLAASRDRLKFLDLIPAEERDGAGALLERLAATAADASSTPEKRDAENDPFPSVDPWSDPVDGAELLDDLCAVIRRHVVLPPFAAEVIALWIVHTYAASEADYTPYLLVVSPVRECGKSTLLDLLAHLAYRGKMTGGITAAALYRTIDKSAPSMLMDELDTRLRGDGGEMLRGVLNTGFQRAGGTISICEGDKNDVRDFSTFCPKVLAGIGRLWDTVTSRSIPIRMTRATKAELTGIVKIRGDRIQTATLAYRRRLVRFVDDSRKMLRIADPVTPEKLGARQCDVWRPLLAIADLASSEWGERARTAALALHEVAEEEGDYGLLMLEDIRALFIERDALQLESAVIVQSLIEMEHRPWPEFRNGKEITPRGVASLLGRFGIKSKTLRIDGTKTAKGYELGALQPAFTTYLPPIVDGAESEAAAVSPDLSVTSVTNGVTDAVTDVTDKKRGDGPQLFSSVPKDVPSRPDFEIITLTVPAVPSVKPPKTADLIRFDSIVRMGIDMTIVPDGLHVRGERVSVTFAEDGIRKFASVYMTHLLQLQNAGAA